jgi:lipopolysaccharide/colanic/teichoic acid biosynthesis glycosyltransferase
MQGERLAGPVGAADLIVERSRPIQDLIKRAMDLLLGGIALVALSPVLLAIALLVRIDSPGPALFKQERLGKGLKPFTIHKFRTMTDRASDSVHRESVRRTAQMRRSEMGEEEQSFKSLEDPRITRLGRFLRKWNLDELPNLISIVKGDMSLVGPRPALDYELPYYKDWFYQRFAVKPGLTGIWQVERTQAEDYDDMMRMDLRYVETFGVWTDVKLILLTIPAVIRERGRF